MNFKDLKSIIKSVEQETELQWSDYGEEICSEGWCDDCEFCIALKNKGIVISSVETVGGEGSGDHYHYIFSITENNGTVTYFKVDGYYTSYDGVDIEPWDFVVVKKVQVLRDEWEEV